MACDLQLSIQSFDENGVLKQGSTVIASGLEPGAITLDEVVDHFMQLPKQKRERLASRLRDAKARTLTEKDVTNIVDGKAYNFVSNTTTQELLKRYPELQETYKDLEVDPEDNFTLIQARLFKINGTKYFGKIIRPDGDSIFIINNLAGAKQFFNYLDLKSKIKASFEDPNTFKSEFSKYNEAFKKIADAHKVSVRTLVLNVLNDSKFLKNQGEVIQVNKFLDELTGRIRNISELEQYLRGISTIKGDSWEVSQSKLTKMLKSYFPEEMENIDLNKMEQGEIEQFLKTLFNSDDRLMRVQIHSIKQKEGTDKEIEAKEKRITKDAFKEAWKIIYESNKDNKDLGIKKSFDSAVKEDPKKVLSLLNQVKNQLFQQEVFLTVGQTDKGEPRIIGTYKTEATSVHKEGEMTLTLKFPWTSLGGLTGYSYESTNIPEPVKATSENGLDSDGRYNGYYIYEMRVGNDVKYVASRHVVSPNATSYLYNSLDSAKARIDKWNSDKIIMSNSLHTLKRQTTEPRTCIMDMDDIIKGQIVTTLNTQMSYKMLNPTYYKIANKRMADFYAYFANVSNIKSLKTPEQAMVFLNKYDEIVFKEDPDLAKAEKRTLAQAESLVEEILNYGTKSYLVENVFTNDRGQKIAYLKLLPNNGTEIDLNLEKQASRASIGTMQDAADYFNSHTGVNIQVLSAHEIEDFAKEVQHSFEQEYKAANPGKDVPAVNFDKSFKGITYNGTIYLNGSKADVSDMFHEMGHILLGALKANDINAYMYLINDLQSKNPSNFTKTLEFVRGKYQYYAKEDMMEEVAVRMIAQDMFNKKSLVETFKGSEFAEKFNELYNTVTEKYPKLVQGTPGQQLAFVGLLQSEGTIGRMQKNMQITQLIQQYISEGKINRTGDC